MLNSDLPIETATHWGPPTRQACTYTTRRSRTNLRGRFCRPLPCLGAVPLVLQAKNRQENMSSLRLQACVFLPDVQVVQPSKRGRLPSAAKTAPPTPSRPSLLSLLHLYGSKLSAAASPSKALLSLQIRRLLHNNISTPLRPPRPPHVPSAWGGAVARRHVLLWSISTSLYVFLFVVFI